MLKTKKLLTAALAAIIGLSFVACIQNTNQTTNPTPNQGNEQEQQQEATSDIDYTDYSSNYALIVHNNAQKNMVLFMGEPKNGNILGGVKTGKTTHLKKNPDLFGNTSTDFVVFVVTEEDYNQYYKSSPETLASSPYATFYAAYNKNSVNELQYEISSLLTGDYKIIVQNGTDYNIEIRNKSAYNGETLAFSLANSYDQEYHLGEGNYKIFPVFRKYDKNSGEILSSYPTYQTGELAGKPKSYGFSLDAGTKSREFNARTWVKGVRFTPSASYIKIINKADQGLRFYVSENSEAEKTSTGGVYINDGKEMVYSINMAQTSSSSFEESRIDAGFRVATTDGIGTYLIPNNEEFEYKAGYMYTFTITGDPEVGYKSSPLMEKTTDEIVVIDEEAYIGDDGVTVPAKTHKETPVSTKIKATPVDFSTFGN